MMLSYLGSVNYVFVSSLGIPIRAKTFLRFHLACPIVCLLSIFLESQCVKSFIPRLVLSGELLVLQPYPDT